MNRVTIAISKELRAQLKAVGTKGESYNDLVARLLEAYLASQ